MIADILKTGMDEITVSIMNVQKQVRTADCGLFALAFVTVAVHGYSPTELYFDQGKMRPHLIENLQKMEASNVSCDKTQKKRRETLKRITIPVYCICRLPDSGSQIVECTCRMPRVVIEVQTVSWERDWNYYAAVDITT